MCFGGGSEQYDGYKSGDFSAWKSVFDQRANIQQKVARGEMSKEAGDAALANLNSVGNTSYDDMVNRLKRDPNSGLELREVTRQNDIGLGRIGIDKAFSQFDDGYYSNYKDTYNNYYMPELDRQYSQVGDKATASLAERGMLASSVGANTFGNLAREYADARTGITSEGQDQAQKLRGTVENAKSSLYSMNEASANPQAVNAQAIGQATALVAPPTYSPLGQIFANSLNSLAQYAAAARNKPSYRYTSPNNGASGNGSMQVVG